MARLSCAAAAAAATAAAAAIAAAALAALCLAGLLEAQVKHHGKVVGWEALGGQVAAQLLERGQRHLTRHSHRRRLVPAVREGG